MMKKNQEINEEVQGISAKGRFPLKYDKK